MRGPWSELTAAACGALLGTVGVAALDAATVDADAQAGFEVTPGQLRINQRISQAAVRRANRNRTDILAAQKAIDTAGGASGATGPEGPRGERGPQGDTGPRGPAGPTEGDAGYSDDVPAPFPAGFDLPLGDPTGPTVTTTRPGRLHVTASASVSIECASDDAFWGRAEIDGDPIESSTRRFLESQTPPGVTFVPQDITLVGVTEDVVPAGTHEIRARLGPAGGGGCAFSGLDNLHASALVLGN